MGVGIRNFRPYDNVTRAEFATSLSRMLYGLKDGRDAYYTPHLQKLYSEGIISNTNPELQEVR
ncbi:S-layer homology domain-containing protein [bacterium]|nr:S-layer homology domain-containing protein [bacterium]